MTISLAVCAHPSRAQTAKALSAQLNDAPIAWDDGVGIEANHDNAFDLAEVDACFQDADWCIVMEDDAIPIPDFGVQAMFALDALDPLTSPVASLYFGYVGQPRRRIAQALERNDPHWIMKPGLTSAVCIAVRRTFVDPLLKIARQIPEYSMTCDERYSFAAKHCGQQWIPHSYPSLVEHSDIPGVYGAAGIPRHAYKTGGRSEWLNKQITFYERVWDYGQ